MAEIGKDINRAGQLLKNGELVAIPTETVYGLAGNALNDKSILEIFKVKNRPSFDPLIAHIPDVGKLEKYTVIANQIAFDLAESFWPGPLTILLPKKSHIPDILTSGLPDIAVRVPDYPLTLELLETLDFPLAAPSANPFGYVSPTKSEHVEKQLGDKISYILEGGKTTIGIESTIVSIDEQGLTVHRLGGLKLDDLRRFGKLKIELNSSSNPAAPGMLKSHYSPLKKLIIGDLASLIELHKNKKLGVLSFQRSYQGEKSIVLSETGSTDEAARKLFAALRDLDNSTVDVILTEKFPLEGLGAAINDRLSRAAAS